MLGWWKRRKMKLIGTSSWTVNWTDTGERDRGKWLFYESESGRRHFESTHVPSLLSRSSLPGYAGCKAWASGAPRPESFEPIKEIQ